MTLSDVFEFFGQVILIFFNGIKDLELPVVGMTIWDMIKGATVIGLGIFAVKELFGMSSSSSDSVDSISERKKHKKRK